MSKVYVIYGDESQLIENKKQEILLKYNKYEISTYTNETPFETILSSLQEESLFAEDRVYVIYDLPILKTSDQKGNKDLGEWDVVYQILLNYTNHNPVILIYHGSIDQRLKLNKSFLTQVEVYQYKKLGKDDLIHWSEQYTKQNHHPFSQDGREYFYSLMDLWSDVPLIFLKTEFDRLFLFLDNKAEITKKLLMQEGSDFGSKNIFKFTDAFFSKNIYLMLEMLPFINKKTEFERFFAYMEGQLRLQIFVYECWRNEFTENECFKYLNEKGMSVKSYPVKLAYQRCRHMDISSIKLFLLNMYKIMCNRRSGFIDDSALERICITYCNHKEK